MHLIPYPSFAAIKSTHGGTRNRLSGLRRFAATLIRGFLLTVAMGGSVVGAAPTTVTQVAASKPGGAEGVANQTIAGTHTVRLASGVLVASDIAQVIQRGELVVAVSSVDSPPFFYMSGDKLVGIDITLAEQIAAALKVKLRVDRSAKSFNEVVEIVARGDADLGISKLSRTLARAQTVLFSDPYLSLNHALILNRLEFAKLARKRPLPTVLRNFTGTLGVIADSSFVDFAKQNFPKAKIVTYPNWDQVIEAVKKGDVVGAYRDEFEIRRILKSDPKLALTMRTVTIKDMQDQLCIAVGVGSPTLHAFVNQFLSQRTEKLTVDSVLSLLK